jgi:hypothetical protein
VACIKEHFSGNYRIAKKKYGVTHGLAISSSWELFGCRISRPSRKGFTEVCILTSFPGRLFNILMLKGLSKA